MTPEEKIENIRVHSREKELKEMHYYGDDVRTIFLIEAIIIIVMTPFFKNQIPLPSYFSVFGVLVLSMLAGLTSPKARPIIFLNFIVSLVSLLVFGYELLSSYSGEMSIYFIGNFVLSIASVFAVYYSSKTLRGNLLNK